VNRFRAALNHPLGVAIGDMLPPEQIGATARWIETAGYSHVTVPEDCFYLPAQVGATLALNATEQIPVGTSIVSALTRHPAILAMEIAGISRAFPGRFWPGIGLGLPPWLEQMGIMPERPVAAMREAIESIQQLLAGGTVDLAGKTLTLDKITITHPAVEDVPLTMGVMSPMMLRLSGQIADATLFGASAGVTYFEQAMADVVAREMPDQWIDDLALVGTPREVADKVLRWVDAGIDAIAVFLPHPSEPDTLTLLAQEVIPLVAQSQEWRGC